MVIKDWTRYVPQEAVVYEVEIPKKLRFTKVGEGTIKAHKTDPDTTIDMPCLILDVNEEDGQKVYKKWYIASKKAIMTMKPYVEDGTYRKRLFTITKHGVAPRAYYEIEVGKVGS